MFPISREKDTIMVAIMNENSGVDKPTEKKNFTRSQSAKNREIMLGIQHERPPMVNKKMCVLAYLKRYESALG